MINYSCLAKVAGALVFAGISGGIIYILRQNFDEPWHTEQIEIPPDLIGLVIGRKGANIKHIELKSNAKINFTEKDKDVAIRHCIIRGPEDCVKHAKSLVLSCLEEIKESNHSNQITVPNSVIGFVIGAKGRYIKDISSNTGVKIDVDRRVRNRNERTISIRGTKEGVDVATQCIQDKIATALTRDKKTEKKTSEVETSGIAVVSPSLVYLLPSKEKKKRLSYLQDEMTDYYESLEGEYSTRIKFEIGDAVAALKSVTGKTWVRGLVVQTYSVNKVKSVQQVTDSIIDNVETIETVADSVIDNVETIETVTDSVIDNIAEQKSANCEWEKVEGHDSNGVLNPTENEKSNIIDNVEKNIDVPIIVNVAAQKNECEIGERNDSNGVMNRTEKEKSNIDNVETYSTIENVDAQKSECDNCVSNGSNGIQNPTENEISSIIDDVDIDNVAAQKSECENAETNGKLNTAGHVKSNTTDTESVIDDEKQKSECVEAERNDSKIEEKDISGTTDSSYEYVEASNKSPTNPSSQEPNSLLYKVFLLDLGEFTVTTSDQMKSLHIQFLEFPHQAQLAKIQGIEERDDCRSKGSEELVSVTKDANLGITIVGYSMVTQRLSGQALIDEERKVVDELLESHPAEEESGTKEELLLKEVLELKRCEGMKDRTLSELIVKEEGIYSLKLQKNRPLPLVKIEKRNGTETLDIAEHLLKDDLVNAIPKKEDKAPDTEGASRRAFHVETILD